MSLDVKLAYLNEGVDPEHLLNDTAPFPITTEVPNQIKDNAE